MSGDIRFELACDLTTARAQSWLGVVRLFLAELDRPGSLVEQSAAYRSHFCKMVVSGLLYAQSHDLLQELLLPARAARPRTVKRVVDLIEADPAANHSLADLARHAGVSARRLQVAFQEALHTTPSAYQRRIKLERARRDLLAGAGGVSEVAYRWGFGHAGRFSAMYRRTFGELPSQTCRTAIRPAQGPVQAPLRRAVTRSNGVTPVSEPTIRTPRTV